MKSVRPHGGNSAASRVAVPVGADPRGGPERWWTKGAALFALLALVGAPSIASAVILSGGPLDVLPGGGGCTITGITSTGSGATVSCTGVNLSAHTKVYFGIRNDSNVNGNTMTGVAPAPSSVSVFRYASETPTSVTYTSTTTVNDFFNGPQGVSNELRLTLATGTATIVPTGGVPTNNANGDIDRLFQVTSANFSLDVDVRASDSVFGPGQACPVVYDPSHVNLAGGDVSKVDVAFYFSDCGDGVIDSPEVCDEGGDNGTSGSCCTSTCQFRAGGEICRPGAGAPCDASEQCTGSNSDCPSDDAPINLGNVCRPGSGDSCDLNETCTGTPGEGCPPDDAPANMGTICRAASAGDICDEDEVCTGAPGATCPADDAPTKINVVCRPGSGDMCDPDERCTGTPGQGCPPDVVANPSTICRPGSGDSCDPNETCTAVPGEPCPSDVVQPMGTICRMAAGQCDVAEQCSGTAGETCPANGFVAANTACDQDANVCTIDECNGSGSCVFDGNLDCEDGNVCTQDMCDPQDGCESVGAPSNSCLPATKGILKIRQDPDPAKDSVRFLWRGGPTLIADMGDPVLGSTRYELCIYDPRPLVQMAMGVPAGANWDTVGSASSPKGYKYKDLGASIQGVKLIKTKGSNFDNAKLIFIGKGAQLPDDAMLPFQFPVTAQVYASDGACWEAEFSLSQTRKNEENAYRAKTP